MKNKLNHINQLLNQIGFKMAHLPKDRILEKVSKSIESLRLDPSLDKNAETFFGNIALQFLMRRVISLYDVRLVLDIGANEGQFASQLRDAGYLENVVSVEPGSEAFRVLSEAHPVGPTQENLRCLVGAAEGIENFPVSKSSVFSSMLEPSREGKEMFSAWMETGVMEEVEMTTIQKLVEKFASSPSGGIMLKTDTQGYDLEVLRGADYALGRIDSVLIEYPEIPIYDGAPDGRELDSFLRRKGFLLAGMFPISHKEPSEEVIEFDALYIRDRTST